MPLGFRLVATTLFSGLAFFGQPSNTPAQQSPQSQIILSTTDLPDAPTPNVEVASVDPLDLLTPFEQDQAPQQPAPTSAPAQVPAVQDSSQTPTAEPVPEKTKQQKADEQIKQQEHQRVLGIIPSFNTSYVSDAVSLTPKQKVSLAFRSAVDPYTFAIAFIVAGMGEADGGGPGFGWGPKGYFERSGAAYLDAFDGTMVGNAFLPIILHQDPRYFRLGHGSFHHRLFYAVATSFICKHDNTGKWEPNYSNIAGNIISGEISNLYYPDTSKSNIAQTFESGITVTLEGTFGATLQEFWPDISRKLFHKDPTNGLDAQARAADQAAKKAKQSQPSTQSQQ